MVTNVTVGEVGTVVPEVNSDYYVAPEVEALFARINKLAATKTQKILLKGPHGAGKTEMALQFAARTGRPILIMDCANLREPRDWFGYKTIENGQIVWHTSLFDRVLSKGNVVICLDELNRASPSICNVLNPLLDARGQTYLEDKGGQIVVGPNVVFFATINEGAIYTGTHAMDAALRDRWPRIVEVTYLPRAKEAQLLISRTGIGETQANALVEIASQIRRRASGLSASFSEGFSTRQLIAVAEDFVHGGPSSLTYTMTNLFSAEGGTNSERAAVLQLIQGKFGTEAIADAGHESRRRLSGS